MELNIPKMNDEELLDFINFIKNDLKKSKRCENASEDEINKIIMDSMFEGFIMGDLRRKDLARIAQMLGYELTEEFMNDPRPDPYDLKNKDKQ